MNKGCIWSVNSGAFRSRIAKFEGLIRSSFSFKFDAIIVVKLMELVNREVVQKVWQSRFIKG